MQEEERRFLAHELHDEIGQVLTGLNLLLDMLRHKVDAPAHALINEARTIVGDLMNRVRTLSLNLRPSILDDLGVLAALEWHFERYTAQTNIRVRFQNHGLHQRFSADIETAIYRIVQEALTNTARYAGVASVQVSLVAENERIQIGIDDEGRGFDQAAVFANYNHAGLAGVHERVELLNGTLQIESAPGQGTHIRASLPLEGACST
ncbi:MAG: sensor histidine kinase [Blastochloris sp.]|nr:sensor histidine kinase [Blastochloris sp.]